MNARLKSQIETLQVGKKLVLPPSDWGYNTARSAYRFAKQFGFKVTAWKTAHAELEITREV